MNLKIVYNGETKRVPKLPESFAALLQAIKQAFQDENLPSDFVAKYYDTDGDLITVSSQEDFEAMMASGTNPIKLHIVAPGQAIPSDDPFANKSVSSVKTDEVKREFKNKKEPQEIGALSSEDDEEDDEDDKLEDAELAAEEKEGDSSSDEDDEDDDSEEKKEAPKGKTKENPYLGFENEVEEEMKEPPKPTTVGQEAPKGQPSKEEKSKPADIKELKTLKEAMKQELKGLKERKAETKVLISSGPEGEMLHQLQDELKKLKQRITEQKEALANLKKHIKKAKKNFKQEVKEGFKQWKQAGRLPRHEGVSCDRCSITPIIGKRYHCLECPDYDLCERCHQTADQFHKHKFEKVRAPRQGPFGPGTHAPPFGHGHHGHGPWGRGKWAEVMQELQRPGGPERLAQQYGPLLQQYRPMIQQYAPFIDQFLAGAQGQPGQQAAGAPPQQVGSNVEPMVGIEWRQTAVNPPVITTDGPDTIVVAAEVTNRAPSEIPANTFLVFVAGYEGNDMIPLPQLKPGEKSLVTFVFKNPKQVGKFESIYKCVVSGAGEQQHVSQCSVTFEVKQGSGNSKDAAIAKAKALQEIFSSKDFEGILKIVEENPNKTEAELVDLLMKEMDDLYS